MLDLARIVRQGRDFARYIASADMQKGWTLGGAREMAKLIVDGRKDLYAALFVHALNTPDKPAIVENGRVTTYAELNRDACRFGNALYQHGVRRRDKVVVAYGNSTEAIVATAGAAHLGATVVPCSTSYKEKELAHIVSHSDAKIVCLTRPQFDVAGGAVAGRTVVLKDAFASFLSESATPPKREFRQREADVMLYTSGTTGKPKGAMLNMHKVAYWRAYQVIGACGVSKHTKFYTACPAYHAAPTAFIGFTLTTGGTVHLDDRFDAERTWKYLEDAEITHAFMVPTQIVRSLAIEAKKPPRLERLFSGGAALPAPVKAKAIERWPVHDFYGATELGLVTIAGPDDMRSHPGTIGREFPGVDVRFLDDAGKEVPTGQRGALYVTSEQFDFGYYKNEEATRNSFEGRYRTVGDIGYRDGDGFLYVVDRKSDMIVSGGVNIYPAEIEQELLEHPNVEDAAVVGAPDPEWGESVVVFVVARAPMTKEEVITFCESRLSKQKKPKRVEFVTELPRSPQGKVLKRELRDRLTHGTAPDPR